MSRGEIDPGLARVTAALARLGSPERKLRGRCLHVAGTNGKGSVCAMMFSVLRQAQLRAGLFTSPHLLAPSDSVRLAERGTDRGFSAHEWRAAEEEVAAASGLNQDSDTRIPLTVFELQVVTTLLLFAKFEVDVAVIEVGMGGREDATNVLIEPAACGISSIALDHEKFLGPTEEDIARHKAGIFQKERPAFVATDLMSDSVRDVIAATARDAGTTPTWVEPAQVVSTGGPAQHLQVPGFGRDLLVPLLGDFQRSNCGLAVAMLLALRGQGLQSSRGALQDVLDDGTITEGIAATRWPGRLEWVETHDLRLLVDGAHNPHAARALGRFVETLRPQPITWVVALSAGKDVKGILQELLCDEDGFYGVSFSLVESMPWVRPQAPEDVVDAAKSLRRLRCAECVSDLGAALQAAKEDPVKPQVVVCGSLYLVADVVRTLNRPCE